MDVLEVVFEAAVEHAVEEVALLVCLGGEPGAVRGFLGRFVGSGGAELGLISVIGLCGAEQAFRQPGEESHIWFMRGTGL